MAAATSPLSACRFSCDQKELTSDRRKNINPQEPRTHSRPCVLQHAHKRVLALLASHVAHKLKVARGLWVDHHCALDGDVADQQRVRGETRVQTMFRVLEERANGGKRVISLKCRD